MTARARLTELFQTMVAKARDGFAMPLPDLPKGRLLVLGAGKAAAAMARRVDAAFGPDARVEGAVVVPYGYGEAAGRIHVIEASHPTPDTESQKAGAMMLARALALGPDDHLLMLMSGGASSLLVVPRAGLSLEEKRAANRELLASGLPIGLINGVRKRLSAIKGGRLALAAAPAPVTTLVISDVPGDDPSEVGSGPTIPDNRSTAEVVAAIAAAGVTLSEPLASLLADPAAQTPRQAFGPLDCYVVMTAGEALAAAERKAQNWGYDVVNLGAAVEGEAREVAAAHAALARRLIEERPSRPILILSGGETSVTIRGNGRGGRNTEYLLALAIALKGVPFAALAADTDGIDGVQPNAGAYCDSALVERAAREGLDLGARLADNDSAGVFAALQTLILTGPTRTNVNDFRAILLGRPVV